MHMHMYAHIEPELEDPSLPPGGGGGGAPPAGSMSMEELQERVRQLFPKFRPNSILRFSSLLGVTKPSSLPRVWQGARKPATARRKKPRREEEGGGGGGGGGEGVGSHEWKLALDYNPTKEMCLSDDEVRKMIDAHVRVRTNLCMYFE